MTSDGHRLRQSWSNSLNDALTSFRGHLTSAQSPTWKRVPIPSRENSTGKGKSRASPLPDVGDVILHRKSTKAGDVYRAIVDVALGDELGDLEAWKSVLSTPELRQEWDPAVETSQLIEIFDPDTRIVKTKFTLGWPASPRDAVMISRNFSDATTVINVSTSVPRSPDEPSYLRPSPPYVRSHVDLFAWCIQLVMPPTQNSAPGDPPMRKSSNDAKVRITCFWQHDLRALWNFNPSSSLSQQLPAMVIGLLSTVIKRGSRVTKLTGYGHGVSVERLSYEIDREALTVEYAIIPEDRDNAAQTHEALHGLDELYTIKEQRRLERSVECVLPSADGWEIRITTRASSDKVAQLPWSAFAYRIIPSDQDPSSSSSSPVAFQVNHSPLPDDHSVVRTKISIEHSKASKGIRLNGVPQPVEDRQARDLIAFSMSNQLTQDASSAFDLSFHTGSSAASINSDVSSSSTPRKPTLNRADSMTRTPAADKSILARVRRNYIYFSSLLQEPEAKWKRNTEARGVSVTQLDSIDPTLVVYRAEATFVGVGLWDLYSAVVTPGARVYWDKQFEDASLLEDVNELTELWHVKTKPAWPVVGRDAVLLKTVYKSPTTVHVFAFSVDDPHLFNNVPQVDPNVIRTQVDLQGWAIEALSPTTTLITLLEQSDPKGWSGKSNIPQQMIANVAGVGEFAIKCGGPPVLTRLGGAKANNIRYEHDRGIFRVEYESSRSRRLATMQSTVANGSVADGSSTPETQRDMSMPYIECELRCDIDTWATSLDIVIDPPPQSMSCLRRHRLSAGGGGLWLTFGHDAMFAEDDRLQAIVRRAPLSTKEKGVVMINGRKVPVDVEELPESEVKSLSKQKRVKPVRVPLDQPPVLGVIRRRRQEMAADNDSSDEGQNSESITRSKSTASWSTSAPKMPSPLANFFTMAYEQATSTTQQAVAAFKPPAVAIPADTTFTSAKAPMQHALEALAFAQAFQRGSYRDNWTLVSDKGLPVHRRLTPEVSPAIPVHKGEKVIESVTAEEVASAITTYDCRKRWDDRFDSVVVFEEFGADCHCAFLVTKGGFPFRDRGFYLASVTAKECEAIGEGGVAPVVGAQSPTTGSNHSTVIYCVSASFHPDAVAVYSPTKYNTYALPVGRMLIDAWILETLDPYTTENYAIPSTRCTRLVAVDYAGSVPVAVNSMINSTLPKSILALETHLKGKSTLPLMKLPASGLLVARQAEAPAKDDAWVMKTNSTERVLVSTEYTNDTKTFRGKLLVSLKKPEAPPGSTSAPSQASNVDITPTPSRIILPPSTSIPTSSPERSRNRADSTPSSPVTPRHRTTSVTTGSLSARSRSRDAVKLTSSMFSPVREFVGKPQAPSDFVLAEVVVDPKLFYPDGYEVRVCSRMIPVPASASVDNTSTSLKSLPMSSLVFDKFENNNTDTSQPSEAHTNNNVLPIEYTIHKLPLSALQSSSTLSSTDRPPPARQLLRLTLPTAQYDAPTIEDPLTGEKHAPPAKPAWMREMEEGEAMACVLVEVVGLVKGTAGGGSGGGGAGGGKKGKRSVLVNGVSVVVGEEKESAKGPSGPGVGDGCLGVLSRVPREDTTDPAIPAQLSVPIAVADHLYDERAIASLGDVPISTAGAGSAGMVGEDGADGGGDTHPATPVDTTPMQEKTPTMVQDGGGGGGHGLLGFLNSYPNQLLRFASSSTGGLKSRSSSSSSLLQLSSSNANGPVASSPASSAAAAKSSRLCATTSSSVQGLPASVLRAATAPYFSLSTLVFTCLIAFLLGSLLRSLLSPADFIYVVSDLGDLGDLAEVPGGGPGGAIGGGGGSGVEAGWREIKRLLEVKYIVGGWDFQVAVVRRH
ncbi:hypothetical protein BD410DRAFT_530254 [Rickenella mellea]|uniref:START domain-containing protein n=1 Tax=Rickenella mellea TaxID=50990 RepID=A0A4Y7QII7_9AGAM|nr:hypothetical protein BD410DRAFT_530254 [Rickenella mellea]